MIFPNNTGRRAVFALFFALFCVLSFLVLSCDVAREDGHTYINVRKDTAWADFDSLEITWKDSISGTQGTLFDGNPADLKAANKLPADGYQGGKIVVIFKGYENGGLVYEERRGFDGADPAKVTKEIVPIVPIDGPKAGPEPDSPEISDFVAVPGPIISINDSISFSATAALDSGTLKNFSWSYEGGEGTDFFGASSPVNGKSAAVSGGHRYAKAGTYQAALKVLSGSDSIAIARIGIQVLQDPPAADAGKDTTVYTMAKVELHGKGKDELGRIVKMEWKIGALDSAFPGSDTAFIAPSTAQDLIVLFQVTDDDGQTAADTMIVHVIPEDESNLTALGVSLGALTPQFDPGLLAYSVTVPNGASSISLKPEGSGVILVNGIMVGSGQFSGPINLAVGGNTISINVRFGTAADKTYLIQVTRAGNGNPDLSDLALSAGTLVSAFSPEAVFYTLTLPNPVDSIFVTATAATAASTLAINKQAALSGVPFPVKIPTGVSAITIVVTAPGGEAKTYTVIITREKNGNADLTRLNPSADTLKPVFDRNTTAYTLAVMNEVGALTPFTLTPEMSAATSTYAITVNGVVLGPAETAAPIALRVGNNNLEIKVRAENGDSKTYTLTVTRATNGDAALASLTAAPGALDPVFDPGDTSYAVAVGNATASITVTPVKTASTSKITVNGNPVSSGSASEAIPLAVGPNVIPVIVTAENLTTRTYLLTVTRARNGNTELSGLVPSVGTLSPAFKPGLSDYGFQAAFADSLVRITPSAADSHSTLQVNGKAVASGSASEYQQIQVGGNANRFIIVVTAGNQAQKVYNVSVNRLPNSLSTLKSLAVSSGTLVQKNALEYADTVSHSTLSVTLAPVASDPNAVVTIAAKGVTNGLPSPAIPLAIGDNPIECQVTAQDGETQTLYTVHVTRLALLTRARKLGSEASLLDSAEIPLGRAYQISAPVETGFHFVKWATVNGSAAFGDANASATSVTLPLGDARIQAEYDTNTYTLAVTAANCTVARSPDLAAYNHGKSVLLTVTSASGFQFASWADGNTANPRTVSMVSNTVLSVTCAAIPIRTLTLGVAPSGSGGVTANPAGPAYFQGTNVSLTPNPAAGHHFVNWTGDLTGSVVPGAVSMTADKSITANFAPDQFTLTVTRAPEIPNGCVTAPTGSVLVGNGTAKAITTTNCKQSVASCGSGTVYLYYDFTGWSAVSGAPVFASAGSASTTVTLSSGDATIRANYAPPRDECE